MKIGVAIPSYRNDLPYIRRCLDSIERQTYKPGCVAISISSCGDTEIPEFSYSFPVKVKVTTAAQNAGTNRNRAAELLLEDVSIDVISFFDCDDEMIPERLEYISKAFEDANCDFVIHSLKIVRSVKEQIQIATTPFKVYASGIIDNPTHCGVMVNPQINEIRDIGPGHISVRRSIYEKWRFQESAHYVLWEDSEYAKKLVKNGYRGDFIACILAIYHNYKETIDDFLCQGQRYAAAGHNIEASQLAKMGLNICRDENKSSEFIKILSNIDLNSLSEKKSL